MIEERTEGNRECKSYVKSFDKDEYFTKGEGGEGFAFAVSVISNRERK